MKPFIQGLSPSRLCDQDQPALSKYIYDYDNDTVSVLVFVILGILIIALSLLLGWAVVKCTDARAAGRSVRLEDGRDGDGALERYLDDLETGEEDEYEDEKGVVLV